MANITQTSLRGNGPVTVTTTPCSGTSDTLVYAPNTMQVLEIRNTTGGSLDVVIDGAGATTISPPGYGGTVDISTGKTITVPANDTVLVNLDSISAYLQGSIAITGGTAGQIVFALYGI